MVQLNPATGQDATMLSAVLYAVTKVSQDQKVGVVESLNYAQGQFNDELEKQAVR